jgi:uroporphyrin-III C-methyltransferase / precorrin-2 dehydrogenase / sirohydrochlorin ferrochelatase
MAIESLPLFHRIAGRAVVVLGEGEAAEAKARLVERAGGRVCGEDDLSARLAFVALAEPEAAAERLRARGVLVNVPDRPELCDFTVPSVLDRRPVLIAIGTGGASAGLAKALRLRLEALLPASLGMLAQALGAARAALASRWPDAGDRRRALDAAFGEGGALDPLRDGEATERVKSWLNDAAPAVVEDAEFILTSDDFEDLTLRQTRLLGSADLIAYEPDVPPAILDRARADAARQAIAKGEPSPRTDGLVITLRR